MNFCRALSVWLVLMTVEVVHGTLRTLFLTPRVGDFKARQISVLSGSVLIVLTTYLFIGWLRVSRPIMLLRVGVLWLVLTLAFELGLGHYVAGRTWANLAADFKLWEGGLLPLGLLVLTAAPWIALKLRA